MSMSKLVLADGEGFSLEKAVAKYGKENLFFQGEVIPGDEWTNGLFKINPNGRYKVEEGYKVSVASVDGGYKNSFYVSDFEGLVRSGSFEVHISK